MKQAFAMSLLTAGQMCLAQTTLEALPTSAMGRGCSCSFHAPFERGAEGAPLVYWELGGEAKIKVEGQVLSLQPTVSQQGTHKNRGSKIGERVRYRFSSPKHSIVVACTVLEACPVNGEGCEQTTYRAKLALTSSYGNTSLLAWGSCGC
jgi:hypothetical protein